MQIEHIEVEDMMIPVHAPETIGGRTRYTEEFVAYCFSLYVQEAGRNVRVLKEIIQERHNIEVPQSSFYNWVKRGNWQQQGRDLYQLLRPGYITDALDAIVIGAQEGASVLRSMANGSLPTDMNRAKVIFGLMDRAGLMPHSAVAEHVRSTTSVSPAHDSSALSDAELRELEASYQPNVVSLPDAAIQDAQVIVHSPQ